MSSIVKKADYEGRRPDDNQMIKMFNYSNLNLALWMYKKVSGKVIITPEDQKNNVLIPQDLYVSGSINSTSDASIKENVVPISYEDCDKLLDLKPKQYNFIDDDEKKKHYGLIAQEVEETYPLLVSDFDTIDDKNNICTIKTVNYIELIPIMIYKMQKMQDQIDELRNNF